MESECVAMGRLVAGGPLVVAMRRLVQHLVEFVGVLLGCVVGVGTIYVGGGLVNLVLLAVGVDPLGGGGFLGLGILLLILLAAKMGGSRGLSCARAWNTRHFGVVPDIDAK